MRGKREGNVNVAAATGVSVVSIERDGASRPDEATSDVDIHRERLTGGLERFGLRPKLIDLFCGAGGMTLGFTGLERDKEFRHRFEPVWANDFDRDAVATYNGNFGDHCVEGDILDLLKSGVEIPRADVVIGGPPCQGFSLLNKKKDGDGRRELWEPFLDVVEKSSASIFVMENVPQLLGSFEHGEIVGAAKEKGFRVRSAILCAADYGVPQMRWRAFVVGCNFGDPKRVFPPVRTNCGAGTKTRRLFQKTMWDEFDEPARNSGEEEARYVEEPLPYMTVRGAIGDLADPIGTDIRNDVEPPYDLHFGRRPTAISRLRYMAVPEGGNRFDLQTNLEKYTPPCWIKKTSGGTDLFGRLWWNRPAVTIRTEFFKPEKGRYLHPERHRPITHREAARLQSFPDGFRFRGSKIEIARQIGNAVPPRLAARIADAVYALLLERESERLAYGNEAAGLGKM